MLRRLSMLALVVTLAACEDDGDDFASIDDARIHIVAGDGQVASVATAQSRAGALSPGAFALADVADDYDLFPEILEVEVRDDGPSALLVGPSFAVVPAGTDVHWIVRDDGCGRPVGQTTSTDESGRTINRWIRGTVARDCRMDVCRILGDGALACDTTFTARQLPGNLDYEGSMYFLGMKAVGETRDYGLTPHGHGPMYDELWHDIYGNVVPYRMAGTRFVYVPGEQYGAEDARMLYLGDDAVLPGDTATLRFEREGPDGPVLLLDLAVEVTGQANENGIVPILLTVRQVAH